MERAASTPRAAITPEAHEALVALFRALGWTGQRGAAFSPGLEQLGQVAIGAFAETAWLLEIAHEVAIGGDLEELLALTPMPRMAE